MDIKTIFEDEHLLVVSKPAGMETQKLGKWGQPAHRLDKQTSGLIILAKNEAIKKQIQQQFKNRQVTKEYLALVLGNTPNKGKIEGMLARDPSRKKPFKLLNPLFSQGRGKPRWSLTEYQKIKSFEFQACLPARQGQPLSLLKVKIKTGRTHQIRVQLYSNGFPILGDKIYTTKAGQKISQKLKVPRQFLHASYLAFQHPLNQRKLVFKNDLPRDLKLILRKL